MSSNNHTNDSDNSCNGIIPLISQPSLSHSRRIQQRQTFPSHTIVNLANDTIKSINSLASSFSDGVTSCNLLPLSHQLNTAPLHRTMPNIKHLPQSSSHRVHQRVYSACQRYSRHLNDHYSSIGNSNGSLTTRGDRHYEHEKLSYLFYFI